MTKRSTVAKWLLLKTAITTSTATNLAPSAAFVASRSVSSITAAATPILSRHLTPPQSPFPSRKSVDRRRNHSIKSDSVYRGKSSLFESMRTGYYRKTNSDEISIGKLLEKAASVRSRTPSMTAESILSDSGQLFFPSSYDASKDDERRMTTRGFSNWIVPGSIMVGQYPGRVPETSTPKEEEIEEHLRRVLFAAAATDAAPLRSKNVCFVSLQSELPPQDDYESWSKNGGEIYLGDPESRKQWPNPFSHYAPTVDKVLKAASEGDPEVSVRYIHHPIRDLSVPSNSKYLRLLLWKILDFLDSGPTASMVYIHCWGGRGRAGLTASCLLTLLEFASSATPTSCDRVLELVQEGYASRVGSEDMPPALSRSPQTESQRAFVRTFYDEVRAEAAGTVE